MSILTSKKFIIPVFLLFLVLYNCNAQVSTITAASQSASTFPNKADPPPIQDVVPLAFQQIGEELGMPKYISCMEQDEQGFLWIGSQIGLFRYDGVALKQFKHIEEDTTSLADSDINDIYIDQSNTLWVITEIDVLHRYDAHLEQFHRINLIPATKDTIPVEVANIIQDKSGVFWLATYSHGLNQLDIVTGELTPINTAELDVQSSFSELLEDQNGNIWTKSYNNLFCVFLGKEASVIDSVKAYLAIGPNINTLMEDTDGTIWIGGENTKELYYIPSGYKTILKYSLEVNSLNDEHEEISTLAQAGNGNIWIGSDYWLGIIHPTSGQQTFFDAENGLPAGITNPSISSFFVDKTGGIVLGSWGGGLSYYDPNLARFGHFQHLANNTNSLSNNDINGIYEAEAGAIWVATINGLNKFDRPTGQVKRFVPKLPLSPYIYSVVTSTTSKSTVWVGSNAGLLILNPTSGQFSRWKSPTKAGKHLESDLIIYLQKAADGTLWVVSEGDEEDSNIELSFFEETLGDFRLFNLMYRNKQIRVTQSGYVLDAANHFWLISDTDQLFSFNFQTEELRHFPISTTIIEQIRKHEFFSLLKDQQDRIWIGTIKGLYLLTPSTEAKEAYTSKRFTEKDGLPDNSIWGLLEDKKGNIWISTSNGLSKLDTKTMDFRNYSKADGLQGNSYFSNKSGLKSTTGEFYFAGLNGFNVFNPDSIINNPIPPSLSITSVSVFRDSSMQRIVPTPPTDNQQNPKIELIHGDKLLKIKYVSPNIGHPKLIQYAVQLEGYDTDWRYVGNENEAVYTNLDPEEYVFRVKAANKDGIWNEVGTALTVIVYSPWWRTKWIYGLCLLFFSGGMYILYHLQRKKNQEETEALRLQEMAQLKSRFYANVSHEIRTPLTLILGPLDATLKRNKLDAQDTTYLKMAQRSGHQLHLLVNSLLDLSKFEVKQLALQEKSIGLYPLMSSLLAPFKLSAKIKGIDLILNYLPDVRLTIQLDVDKFEIIINNLLSNALKFTPKDGKIIVQVRSHQQQIELKVSDTGKGIAAEDLPFIFDRYFQTKQANQPLESGTGIGLALSKEYAQLFKGDISVSSILGKSSTFTLIFPKKEATEIAPPNRTILAPSIESNSIELNPTLSTKEQKAKPKLLIVDDNKDMRLYIQSILQDTFQCYTAENGQIAWDWLNGAANITPDIIISDLMMPVLDGFGLLKKLKASDQWRTTPVIILTARSAKEVRLKALTIGIDDYLNKPFDAEELAVRVKNLLQNHLARKIQLTTPNTTKEVEAEFKPVTSADIEWIKEVTEIIKTDIGKEDINLLHVARKMAISERHLRRRILEITGMNSGAYLKEIKLQKARHFLEFKAYKSVAEVGYAVGFNTPSYFSKIYKARFGKLPSEYF